MEEGISPAQVLGPIWLETELARCDSLRGYTHITHARVVFYCCCCLLRFVRFIIISGACLLEKEITFVRRMRRHAC